MRTVRIILLPFLMIWVSFVSFAQKIYLDKYQTEAGLKLFESVDDPNVFYYLSDQIKIGKDDNGRPQVLFMKYVNNKSSEALEEDIREGDGGGIFHTLLNFQVAPQQVRQAEQLLKRKKPDANIKGPITYASGRVSLISAIADSGTDKVICMDNATTMEGHKIAVSFRLDKEAAQILWQTFQTPTPDISFAFEMEIEGFLSPRKGWVKGDFDQIYEAHEVGLAAKIPVYGIMLGVDVGAAFDDLRKAGIIEVYQEGNDKDFDEFLKIAYKHLADMLFEPTNASLETLLQHTNQKESLFDKLDKLIPNSKDKSKEKTSEPDKEKKNKVIAPEPAAGSAKRESDKDQDKGVDSLDTGGRVYFPNSGFTGFGRGGPNPEGYDTYMISEYMDGAPATTTVAPASSYPFSVMATYKYRRVKQGGKFAINFNKVSAAKQFVSFAENIGDLRSQCPDCFREVNLSIVERADDQREILFMLDGTNEKDFTEYINFVDVVFRKQHQSGEEEVDNRRIIRQLFNQNGNLFKITYGYDGDDDLDKWLEYEYKTTWNFFGNYKIDTDWKKASSSAIALHPPLHRKRVKVETNKNRLDEQNIRMVQINLYYQRGGKEIKEVLTLYEQQSGEIELLIPEGNLNYEYEVTWLLYDNTSIHSKRKKSNNTLLFVDMLPR